MSVRVFIDGSAGTTGLRIADRLAGRAEIQLLHLPESQRKELTARADAINSADLAFLCLPDAASREILPLLRPDVKVLDTSTAFRTAPGWVYGFPELRGQKQRIQQSCRVAVPGCYASGFIALARPLVELGLVPPGYPFSCTGLSGYSLCRQAAQNTASVMPGYTHLQRAQPITFGHALMAYAWMLLRDLERFVDATARMDAQCPLGSGALAGTTYPLDRAFTAEKLGFAAPCPNSLDGVSDRDFCIELTAAMATCMMHLSRLSEEIILWCSWEFKFIELDDAFTTGSSIMPQKKNPDVTELIRGKTGRVYGDLNTLLVMMKGLPLAYNKDMQEDKEAIFDAVDTLELCLRTITPMLDTMKALPENMRRAAAKGFINATDCADYLTKKGLPFRDAYKLTGCMVADCIAQDKTLEELTLEQFQQYSPLFAPDIYEAIDLVHCCEDRQSYGGPCAASVQLQIRQALEQLADWEEANA